MGMLWRKDVIAQLVDEHLDRLSQIKSINDTNDSGMLRFVFVSVIAENDLLFKTDGSQTLEVKEDNKLSDTIAQRHILSTKIICPFMQVIFSKDQTISRLEFSELPVIMSKYDLDLIIQASDSMTSSSWSAVCAVMVHATITWR